MYPPPPLKLGFSLVELSIVLVILGLLTGGILAGQSLIRAAELRAVSTEFSRFYTASQTFRDKYFAIPGDMTNATAFWGKSTACGGASAAGTCDGNGDGLVPTNFAGVAGATDEGLQFWRQLILAGLIEGTYSGLLNASGTFTYGTETPRSKLTNGGYYISHAVNFPGDASAYALDYGNFIELSGPSGPPLKPEEAWNIDTKLDDGKPASGKLIARYWNNACAAADDGSSANNDLVASYRLTDSTKQCNLTYRKLF
ncbi:MAG: type II secretion system protein [Rickettsiales bacterium]